MRQNIVIQGYPGSFHAEAALKYWPEKDLRLIPADSFDKLALILNNGEADQGVMAIENSIAGTLLQNYRILREYNFNVTGEIYLHIQHQLLGVKGALIKDIKQVASHPMAIYQCIDFLGQYPDWKIIESDDTALSAKHVAQKSKISRACIASSAAADIYGLDIIVPDIQSNKSNYTRFFIIQKNQEKVRSDADKASIYIRIPDEKGQLLKVLQVIHDHGLNLSKLQSFPVIGSFREYFFHLDIEFEHLAQFLNVKEDIIRLTFEYQELGLYKRADISQILQNQNKLSVLS
jgi:prephenate dehydratase